MQNFAYVSHLFLHFGQNLNSEDFNEYPQFMQNFACSWLIIPHLGQVLKFSLYSILNNAHNSFESTFS